MNIEEQIGEIVCEIYNEGFDDCETHKEVSLDSIKEAEQKVSNLLTQQREEAVAKAIKTLLVIEGITSDDFMLDVDCKLEMNNGRDKNSFTQEEAQEMTKRLTDIYQLSHNVVASCCVNRHNKMLEEKLKSLIEYNHLGKDSLKEAINVYLSQQKEKGKE